MKIFDKNVIKILSRYLFSHGPKMTHKGWFHYFKSTMYYTIDHVINISRL